MGFKDLVKELLGKIFAVGGIAAIYAVANYAIGNPAGLEWKAMLLIGTIAFWQKGIVPTINELLGSPKTTEAKNYSTISLF